MWFLSYPTAILFQSFNTFENWNANHLKCVTDINYCSIKYFFTIINKRITNNQSIFVVETWKTTSYQNKYNFCHKNQLHKLKLTIPTQYDWLILLVPSHTLSNKMQQGWRLAETVKNRGRSATLFFKISPPHITLSSDTTADGIGSEFRPCSRRKCTRGWEWNPSATSHSKPARQKAQCSFCSMKCRNDFDVNSINEFSMIINSFQIQFSFYFAVGHIFTINQSTFFFISFQQFFFCSMSDTLSSILSIDILKSLTSIFLFFWFS